MILKEFLLIFVITVIGLAKADQCENTRYLVSKCFDSNKRQWLIEVPKEENSCKGKSIAEPQAVDCNLACPPGKAINSESLHCETCPPGTFSLGRGQQYTFNNPQSLPLELKVKSVGLGDLSSEDCRKKRLWQVKDNVLQGDVQLNCGILLTLQFRLVQAGSINITYSLPSHLVFGTISSRCAFSVDDDDNDDGDSDDDEPRKRVEFTLHATGYSYWGSRELKITEAGDYTFTLFTMGVKEFHFPFSIRSITVQGNSNVQQCDECPPGTYTSQSGSSTCTLCPMNTYAENEKSTKCLPCDKDTEYADEGSTKCMKRPICDARHYRKIFTGCDQSDTAKITYEPIQPKICRDGGPPTDTQSASCATCNPGMYKNKATGKCEFCKGKSYSNGTTNECLPCENDVSLLPGLYYKNWNELPDYFNRSYLSFDDPIYAKQLIQSHSWIPSITYISSQAIPATLSVLTLTIARGFRETEIAKSMKEYGTLYFNFSIQCASSCTLFLVSENTLNDDEDNSWDVINKWKIEEKSGHTKIFNYTYSIQHPDEIEFDWLFTSDSSSDDSNTVPDEIRIYEITVTNTKLGGSDRCVTCVTANNEKTECKVCAPGHILMNNTCIHCPPSTIASRVRPTDPLPTICKPCANNTVTDDSISCYVPCKQIFNGVIEYDLNEISTIDFHGSKLFTQKGSGYFHVFNATICGKTNVICTKTPTPSEAKRSTNSMKIESKLCRMGSVPDRNENSTSVAYIDDFGEQLLNVSLTVSKYFPALRSDYNLTDITLVYRTNTSASQSACAERITYLSLRCDHILEEDKPNSTLKYQLQTPSNCPAGTCDGCRFDFLLRTPLACPTCDEKTNGFRTFIGPCKFGRQEVRKVPYPYCAHKLTEKVETRRCSIFSTEIQIILGLFIIIASILIVLVITCWRKNRKLEYRYMQLIENTNPDDDVPVDNVCAQLSDEEDSGEEVQFKTQSKAKKIMNVVRKAIRKNPNNGRSDTFSGDSFLLTNTTTNET